MLMNMWWVIFMPLPLLERCTDAQMHAQPKHSVCMCIRDHILKVQ